MNKESIVRARKLAESSVSDMEEGQFKIAAFQTILSHLLHGESTASVKLQVAAPTPNKRKSSSQASSGTTSRLLALIDDGVFAQQRSLADIRQILAEKGWHYQLQDLGTPVARLVQRRQLRRTQVAENGKKNWKYSLY